MPLYLLPLFPLLGFVLLMCFPKIFGGKAGGWLASLLVLLSFGVALLAYLGLGTGPRHEVLWEWLPNMAQGKNLAVGFYFDQLAALMTLIITGIGFLIHVYSLSYMGHDAHQTRFFAFLNFFVAMMLILVLGDSLPLVFVGWEGVGMASFLLIGFWFAGRGQSRDALSFAATNAEGATVSVRAYVYAQEGSWFILAGDNFDDAVRAATDLDRDAILSRREEAAAHRYHRYNYRFDFYGAICENRSAVLETSGAVRGAVADWTDKWANVQFRGASRGFAPSTLSSAAGNFSSIRYNFDPDAALGKLEDDAGFRLPSCADGWTNG